MTHTLRQKMVCTGGVFGLICFVFYGHLPGFLSGGMVGAEITDALAGVSVILRIRDRIRNHPIFSGSPPPHNQAAGESWAGA